VINVDEGAALGAALLAGVGAGVYADIPSACRATIRVVDTLRPQPEAVALYVRQHELYQALYRHLRDDFIDLAKLK
jgi:xylulokinase